ncbi:helix-turn-helix domain-containing protein [Nodosilinea sp. LEGE 07298]|uniref:helix-turn-helix domain-containing protein n=1 Tax=Nodosilinea sp. LEGE 07298 TaxID=2777970 RepID=UPI001882C0D8|nr:RodZ domain-containing protein [Nodosilinea sp. LEGE 07298]MBE9111763.1 helix-turn-helix domain-containing protein [Nodosilinea sp. LEGE 07298]
MAKLAPTQVEQLQSIGAYLRQVRQEQGLSIDTLANQIFIRPALLQALESGQDAALPEPVFIQGFIRRYAEALGLDGQTISKEFRVTPVDVMPTPELVERADSNGAVSQPEPRPSPQVAEKASAIPIDRSLPRSPLPLLLSLGALALVLGLGAWGLFGRDSATSRAGDLGAEPAIDAPEPTADAPVLDPDNADADTAAESLEALDDSPSAPQEAPVVVSANLSDRAWLSVVADGENVYEGIAESGFEETWTAQSSLVFRTGNAGGVELSVNGDRAVVLGNAGMVRTLTLTPDSDLETVESP